MPEETLMTETAAETKPWYSAEYSDLVTKQGWKDPNDPIRDYNELQKSASGKIKLPTPESSAEEVSAFYAKIRGVDTPDGYEVQVPENVPIEQGMINKLRQWAFEAGAPKTAFETVLRNYLQELSDQSKQSIEVAKHELKEEWKEDYDTNFKMADRFVTNECSEEFRLLLIETGLNNNPVFVKEFLNLAKKTMTDKLIKGDTKGEKEEEWEPRYKEDPAMYRYGDSEEAKRARAWFEARGHKFT